MDMGAGPSLSSKRRLSPCAKAGAVPDELSGRLPLNPSLRAGGEAIQRRPEVVIPRTRSLCVRLGRATMRGRRWIASPAARNDGGK
jgi:hypothetical protein